MRSAAIIALIVLPLIWIGAFLYLMWGRQPSLASGRLSLETLNTVVNVAVLAISALALCIAVQSYRDTTRSSLEQQRTLDASREALGSAVEVAKKQQELLAANLVQTEGLFNLQSEQYRRELEREGKKPLLEIALGAMKGRDLERIETINIDLAQRLGFTVTNFGSAPLIRPIVNITASPSNIFIDKVGSQIVDRPYHNHLSFIGTPDLAPNETPYAFPVVLTVPPDVEEFRIEFAIFGDNYKTKAVNLHFAVGKR